jgi:hypothetical protein
MIGALRLRAAGVALIVFLTASGCSYLEPDITGTWDVEDTTVASLAVQIGPRLEISQKEIVMPDLNISRTYADLIDKDGLRSSFRK